MDNINDLLQLLETEEGKAAVKNALRPLLDKATKEKEKVETKVESKVVNSQIDSDRILKMADNFSQNGPLGAILPMLSNGGLMGDNNSDHDEKIQLLYSMRPFLSERRNSKINNVVSGYQLLKVLMKTDLGSILGGKLLGNKRKEGD